MRHRGMIWRGHGLPESAALFVAEPERFNALLEASLKGVD